MKDMDKKDFKIHGDLDETKDPVCGMTVGLDSPHTLEYEGRKYRFCSEVCKFKFLQEPSMYAA